MTASFHDIERIVLSFFGNLYTKIPAEILLAVKTLGRNKALGPDDFTVEFLIKHWPIFKDTFEALLKNFHNNGRLNACIKENFICLVQKKELALEMKDFRSISLTTLSYKVVAKVLAERLKSVMDSIISPYQSAFIEGRQIFDPILIVNEAVEDYRAKEKKG